MYTWQRQIQMIVDEIDQCIKEYRDEELSLHMLSSKLGYSPFYMTRKFKEISGMQFRDYLRQRKLAFALKKIRDSQKSMLEIALDYGFSSHEAFTRAFKQLYGITPSAYRRNPKPVILRTKITAFDRYLFGLDEIGMWKSSDDIKIYSVTIPAHKFLHVRNYESNGYWDFWDKQSNIPDQDHDTICGLLDSIKGKLDDDGGSEANSGSGQLMAYINDPKGRLCDWGFHRIECYGVRLPFDYEKEVPSQMQLMDVPEAEYLVFEHGPFDYEQENRSVEEVIEHAMSTFDFTDSDYHFDTTTPGRVIYLYYNPQKFCKYIRAIKRKHEI